MAKILMGIVATVLLYYGFITVGIVFEFIFEWIRHNPGIFATGVLVIILYAIFK